MGYVSHAEPGGRWARFIEGGEGGGSSPAAGIAGGADGADFGRVLGFRRQAGHGEGGACPPVVEGGVVAGYEAQYLVFGGPGDESGRVVGYVSHAEPGGRWARFGRLGFGWHICRAYASYDEWEK